MISKLDKTCNLKNITLFIFLIFGQEVLAQKLNGLYFEPTLQTKITTNRLSNLPPVMQTDAFTIKSRQFIGPIASDPGLNIGYTFKNKDKFQFGFSQDEILQGFSVVGIERSTSYGNKTFYGHRRHNRYGGVSATIYSLLYKRNFSFIQSKCFKKDRFISVYFNFGLSYLHKPNNGIENLSGTDSFGYLSSDSSVVKFEVNYYNYPMPFKNSFKFNVGFDFSFGKKDKELFDFTVSFISNRGANHNYFGETDIQVEVSKNNTIKQYSYYIGGRGNGIYFTLSKRIYPFKMYHNRVLRKLEKYKALNP